MTALLKFEGQYFVDFLKKAKPFVSTEETRYYLNGIYFEPSDKCPATATATNGRILIHQELAAQGADGKIKPFILARQDAERLVKIMPKKDGDCFTLTQEEDGGLLFDSFDFKYRCKPVDEQFPDYRRTFPANAKMVNNAVNAQYLRAALAALGNKPVDIQQESDTSPKVFTSSEADGTTCIVMPMRVGG